MKHKVTGSRDLGQGKFLYLRELEYYDHRGMKRKWESCDRTGTGAGCFIFARIIPDNEVLLIRQFRPPVGKYVLEFPAGLIDPGETPEETAVRELYEETGYAGKIISVTRPAYSSPGLTGEPITCVTMEINGDEYRGTCVEAHPEEVECIEVFRVPLQELGSFVEEQEAAGVGVDTKIHMLIAGLTLEK